MPPRQRSGNSRKVQIRSYENSLLIADYFTSRFNVVPKYFETTSNLSPLNSYTLISSGLNSFSHWLTCALCLNKQNVPPEDNKVIPGVAIL